MRIALVSTYELGHQPFGLASPAAWLRAAGAEVRTFDLARSKPDESAFRSADVVAFYLPMHTATRLAVPVIGRVRRLNPGARLVAYGLYAPLNEGYLKAVGIDVVLGPECEPELVDLITSPGHVPTTPPVMPRIRFIAPDRSDLPPLDAYATLQLPTGERRVSGYTEATRGCAHACRHCPIVPVYHGQFRVVQRDVVLADIRAQVAAGARHITFGDPDFLNGPTHARRIVEALAREWPGLTYDVVIKIEHLLEHPHLLPVLRDTGCLFITSAVESVDDAVLARLDKGHTRAGFERAVALTRAAGLTLVPTFLAFTPWTTLEGYDDLLDTIERLGLVEHVPPIQLAIRLLLPSQSRLLELDDIQRVIGPFDRESLIYPWRHADPAVDTLHRDVTGIVGRRLNAPRGSVFDEIRARARGPAPSRVPHDMPRVARAAVPYLNEPWYC